MKQRLYILLCAIILSISAGTTFAAERFLSGLQKMDGITSVYIGKSMLKMVGSNFSDTKLFAGTGMTGNVLNNIDCIDIVTAETEKAANHVRSLIDTNLKRMPELELAMETEEDGEYTRIYVQPSPDGDSYKRMLIIVSEPDEVNVIDMQGSIKANEIEKFNF